MPELSPTTSDFGKPQSVSDAFCRYCRKNPEPNDLMIGGYCDFCHDQLDNNGDEFFDLDDEERGNE